MYLWVKYEISGSQLIKYITLYSNFPVFVYSPKNSNTICAINELLETNYSKWLIPVDMILEFSMVRKYQKNGQGP